MKTSKREFFNCQTCTSVLCIQCVELHMKNTFEEYNTKLAEDPEHAKKPLWSCLKCEGKCPCKRCKNRVSNKRTLEEVNFIPSKYSKASLSMSLTKSLNDEWKPEGKKASLSSFSRGVKSSLKTPFGTTISPLLSDIESEETSSSAEDEKDFAEFSKSSDSESIFGGRSKSSKNSLESSYLSDSSLETDLLYDLRIKWERCEFYREQMTKFLDLIQQQQLYVQQQIDKITRTPSPSSPSSPEPSDINCSLSSLATKPTSVV